MAEYATVVKERIRMCKQIGACDKCPLSIRKTKANMFCDTFMREHPEEADNIIMQWSKEHPAMTNRRKFEEVFGFYIGTLFEVNYRNVEWLDEEYKEKSKNE